RVVARDRYVNGINGEFLCVKGRFGHPFVNHEARLRTPLIRYRKGAKLVPATWDEAIRHVAQKLDAIAEAHGPNAIGVVGSPRLTNEANYLLYKFATELVGTENFSAAEAFTLKPFFDNLGGQLATHHDIRHAKTILLIGGEPEELQPLTGKQIRQAVRNGDAKLAVINSVPIRLIEQASHFIHISRGSEDAVVLALAGNADDDAAIQAMGVEQGALDRLRQIINETAGDLVVMFGGELSAAAQAVMAQLPHHWSSDVRRVLLHPLPLYNNSVGVHDMGLMGGNVVVANLLSVAGEKVRALYVAGSLQRVDLAAHPDALAKLDFLIVQELFETETTAFADVVLPAASFAEIDGTFTNNDGLVQRVRASISPLHQAKPDWVITAQLATELGVDFGFQMSATAVFNEIAAKVPAYAGLRYPSLKDESRPVQVKHSLAEKRDVSAEIQEVRRRIAALPRGGSKLLATPDVGHELFKIGTLTDKVPQFHLLASGNPRPETVHISPLYQITVDARARREEAIAN
ncbi:MAG TPA: molybdopterin-dependent oxidoreductase, partial [Pyrinomonadaceae bacterium]|nr:molybdopterin-dependent oxidoreductase [Pyrinomonadaceae bacterium]